MAAKIIKQNMSKQIFQPIYLPPWSIKFNEQVLVLGELLIEVSVCEYKDAIFGFGRCGDVLDGANDHH